MSFHGATFRLLGYEPSVLASANEGLDEAEQRLGIALPASVRDWYQRESAIRILAEHSNDDPPIEVAKFALLRWQKKILLPIRHENQGVCTWAIELAGSDDPLVVVDVDTDGRAWDVFAPSFSDYVYSCVWDYQAVLKQPALVRAQNCGLTSGARRILAETLTAELTTHGSPGAAQYRFSGSRFGVLIWDAEWQADWHVGAADRDSLKQGLEAVWHIDSVGDAFYACSDAGQEVLTELQSRGP